MVKTGEILVCGNCGNVKNHPPGELNELNILIFFWGDEIDVLYWMCHWEFYNVNVKLCENWIVGMRQGAKSLNYNLWHVYYHGDKYRIYPQR